MAKVLIADDDAKILQLIRRYLASQGYSVVVTDSGSEALLLVRESKPDLLLLDGEMPGLGGHAICRVLKKEGVATPVIIMSGALKDDGDVLAGFEGGADDYVLKPFSLAVLAARIKALLKRGGAPAKERPLKSGEIELDLAGRSAKSAGKAMILTRKEFDLLAALLRRPGQVLSVPYLLETVWGHDPAVYNDRGTVEVHVSHLRKKLGPKSGKRLVSVTGYGYKLETGL
jgi:DNA-binding response OmpR family regulator